MLCLCINKYDFSLTQSLYIHNTNVIMMESDASTMKYKYCAHLCRCGLVYCTWFIVEYVYNWFSRDTCEGRMPPRDASTIYQISKQFDVFCTFVMR